MKSYLLAVLTVAAFFALDSEPARALSSPMGRARAYQVTCAATATLVRPSSDPVGQGAVLLFNGTATAAYLGGSDVNSSTKGMPVCTSSSCVGSSVSFDGAGLYCLSAGGAVVLTVLAGQ